MSMKDDSFEMLDLGPEKSRISPLLIIGLILLVFAGAFSAYVWQQRTAQTPAPTPVINTITPVPPAPTIPKPTPVPTKKVPTPVNIVITFGSDSAEIIPAQLAKLQALAQLIKDTPGTMQISAYTDNLGTAERGQFLSEQRAQAVVQTLKGLGVNANIKYNLGWYGEQYPVADNSTEQGRALNRRVEIYFSPTL